MKLANKALSLAAAFLLVAAIAAGCAAPAPAPMSSQEPSAAPASSEAASEASAEPAAKTTIRVTMLQGPTGLGALKLMDDAKKGTAGGDYQINVATAPDQLTAALVKGDIDVAAVPANLAATLYNKNNGQVQLAVVHTLGVLSLVTKGETINSIADLKGKTIYASGQGATPEYSLNYILAQNGLVVGKDVMVEYKAEHAELATAVLAGKAAIAMLPEPFVTQVTTKDPSVTVALDLTEEWGKAADGKSVLTMGCLVVRKDFAEKNKDAFNEFLKEYKASIEFTNTNLEAAAKLSEEFGIMPAAVAKKAIPRCNIVYIDGAEMKVKIPDFLNVLLQAAPKSIGGKLPGEDFYYAP